MKSLNDIYFYNANELAIKLNNNEISEYTAIKHLIVSLILGGLTLKIPIVIPFEIVTTLSDKGLYGIIVQMVTFILIGVTTFFGVMISYQVNQKGDGKDYFLRFASLALPITIQLVVLFLIIGIILVIAVKMLLPISGELAMYIVGLVKLAAELAVVIMFYHRMRNYMRKSSGAEAV